MRRRKERRRRRIREMPGTRSQANVRQRSCGSKIHGSRKVIRPEALNRLIFKLKEPELCLSEAEHSKLIMRLCHDLGAGWWLKRKNLVHSSLPRPEMSSS